MLAGTSGTRPPHSSAATRPTMNEMEQERGEGFLRLKAIIEVAEQEQRAFTPVETEEFGELSARVAALDSLRSDWHHGRGIFSR